MVTDSLGSARHIDVASNGDVVVALSNSRGPERTIVPGGIVVLRDLDGDGGQMNPIDPEITARTRSC